MTGLLNDLTAIETSLAGLGRKVVQMLRPGLSAKTIALRLAERQLFVDAQLQTLYGWRNGTDAGTGVTLDELHLVPGFYLLSLEDALANYDAFAGDQRWDPAWLPVLANGGGDFLVLDLSGAGSLAPVRHFRIEQSDHPIEYGSAEEMFATFERAFDQGIFYVDSNGYLEMDDEAYAVLAASLNPAVAWWND